MKKISLLFCMLFVFVVCAVQAYASNEWTKISLPFEHRYYSLEFINANTGFTGATEGWGTSGLGHIYKTTNGGLNWRSVLAGNIAIHSFSYEDGIICAVGNHLDDSLHHTSATYYSTDVGEHWTILPFVPDAVCSDVAIQNGIIYVSTYMGDGLYYTTNLGNHWERELENIGWSIMALTKAPQALYVTSQVDMYRKVNDTLVNEGPYGIITWGRSTVINPANQRLYIGGHLAAPDGNHGAIASTENGQDWNIDTLRDSYVTTLAFNERGDAYAGGIVYTAPQTSTTCIWKKTSAGWIEDIDFNDLIIQKIVSAGNTFYAAGTLELYKHTVLTGLQLNSGTIPNNFVLKQNFPNPFNPVTKINYSLSKQSSVSLKVYDVVGKEVAVLVNEIKAAGEQSVTFNGANLSSGIYFYKLQAGDFVEIKKMVLQK